MSDVHEGIVIACTAQEGVKMGLGVRDLIKEGFKKVTRDTTLQKRSKVEAPPYSDAEFARKIASAVDKGLDTQQAQSLVEAAKKAVAAGGPAAFYTQALNSLVGAAKDSQAQRILEDGLDAKVDKF